MDRGRLETFADGVFGIAATLLELAVEDEVRESELRKLAMMCDAMALD